MECLGASLLPVHRMLVLGGQVKEKKKEITSRPVYQH